MLEICYKTGVRVVTVYAFSIENFKRTRREVDGLMALAELKLAQLMQHNGLLQRYGIRVRVLGRRDLVRADLRADIERAERDTAAHAHAVLNVCFPYTSRDEMTGAMRAVVEDWARPLPPPQPQRSSRTFSQTHISNSIRSRRLSSASPNAAMADANGKPDKRGHSPYPPSSSAPSDADETATLSSAPTLQQPVTPPDAEPSRPVDLKEAISTLHDRPPLAGSPTSSAPTFPDAESIDAATLSSHLFTAGCPPVDLLIRTSGVERLSDFLLWQVHENTEIVFLKCLWPEFDLWQFLPVLVEWQWRRRKEAKEHGDGGSLRSPWLGGSRNESEEVGVKVD